MNQTFDQQRFTISQVAAVWHELMALCAHPLTALTDNGTHGAASRHTVAQISHTIFTPYFTMGELLLISRPTDDRRLSWPERTAGYQLAQGCLQ